MFKSSLLAAAVSLSAVAHADVPNNFVAEANAYLDSVYQADAPGAAIIVVDDGEVVLRTARGVANKNSGEALTADSVFRIGSITKQFASSTMMHLVEQGKVSLDDPLSKYLPDYPGGDKVTIHHLLNHTSGIKSYTGIPGWLSEEKTSKAYTTAEMVAEFKDQPSDFEPGQGWLYNNSGYYLVGAVIEAATGKAWHEVLRDELLQPADISTIRYTADEASVPHMALGYTLRDDQVTDAQPIHPSVPGAAGALLGDVSGLANWYAALFGKQLVSEDSLERMTTPTEYGDGKIEQYGYGLGMGDIRGHATIGHSGGIFGFSSNSVLIPDEGLVVIVLANSDSPSISTGVVMQRLAGMAMGDPYPVFEAQPYDLGQLEPILGRYQFDGSVRDFYARDGKLYARRDEGREAEIFYGGDDRFFYGNTTLTYFEIDDSGEAPVIRFYQNGNAAAQIGTRAGDVPEGPVYIDLTTEQAQRLVGVYSLPFGDFTVALQEDGTITGQLAGQSALPVKAVSETELRAEQVGAKLTFTIEGDQAISMTLEQGGGSYPAPRKAD